MPCNYLSYSYILWISRTSTNISCQTSHKHQYASSAQENTTTTVLQPSDRTTCFSHHLQLRTGGFFWCKVLLLLMATSAFGFGRKHWSSPQQCYLHTDTVITILRSPIGGKVTKQHENRPSNRLTGEPQCWYGWWHTTSATERWPRVAPSDTGSWFLTRYHLPWQLPTGRCTSPTMLTLRCSMNLQQTYTGHTWLCKLKSSVILTQKHKLLYAL